MNHHNYNRYDDHVIGLPSTRKSERAHAAKSVALEFVRQHSELLEPGRQEYIKEMDHSKKRQMERHRVVIKK